MTRIFAESNESIVEEVYRNTNTVLSNVNGTYYIGMGVTGDGIPDNSRIVATGLGSNQVTLSNTIGGSAATINATFNKTNYNVPTNPKFRTFGAFSGNERLYTIIYEHTLTGSAENFVQQLQGSDSADTEYLNLETTEGFRIKNFHAATSEGVSLSAIDLNTYNYFVLIHSDNHLLHHFAKITQLNNDDNAGDSFDFEPRLGTEIAEGTKFMVFRGPKILDDDRGCKILAVSAGIKNNLQEDLVCAEPLFYFFNDNLDKKNQLDHNTKYFMKFKGANTTTTEPSVKNTFVTSQDNGYVIKDYSKYTMNLTLTDNLKDMDYPAYAEVFNIPRSLAQEFTSGTYQLISPPDSFGDYDDCFHNAKRSTNLDIDPLSNLSYRGPTRYVHYDFSPTRANKLYNVIDLTLEESIGTRGSYCETKVVDTKRLLPAKINTFDKLRVRHRLHKGNFNDWFALKAKIKSYLGLNEYRFTTEYDLSTMFNLGDEVKIGNRILIVETIDAINNLGTTGKEQDVKFRAVHRLETGGIFSSASSYSLTDGSVIYRRAWNTTDSTLLTTFDILENRNDRLYVKLISKDFSFLEATVTNSDKNKQLLTLSFPTTTNTGVSALDYMEGSYYIEVEKFDGSIEKNSYYKENGQTIFELSGRSEIRKLLGPIINKNTLHSKDIIYSSHSPYTPLIPPQNASGENMASSGNVIISASMSSPDIVVSNNDNGSGSAILTTSDEGKLLFAHTNAHSKFIFLGILKSVSGNTITLHADCLTSINETGIIDSSIDYSYELYTSNSKYYMFNKAMSANTKTNTVSTLSGASNKGLYFNGGTTLNGSGGEVVELVGSSANTNNSESVGYYISGIKGVKKSPIFEGRLDDGRTNDGVNKAFSDFDTVNTLLDFTVLNITEDDNNNETIVELAPYIPLTLGRVDINYANMIDTDLSSTDLGQVNASTVGNRYFTIPATSSTESLSSTANQRKHHGNPVYASTTQNDNLGTVTYLGRFIQADLNEAADTITIYVSKVLEQDIDNLYIRVLNYQTDGETSHKTHEMNFLNGAHLHGGKTIILANPENRTSTDNFTITVPLNYELFQSSETGEIAYADKYGSPYYRIFNIEKGNINKTTEPIACERTNALYYSDISSKIKYYANAYRGIGATNLVHYGKTGKDAADNHILPESRGWTNAAGSKFFEQKVTKSGGSPERVAFYKDPTDISDTATGKSSPFTAVDNLDLLDPKIARMFLFINGDIVGYSSARKDSLLRTGRSLEKYNLFLLKKPSIVDFSDDKEQFFGGSKNINLNDSSYSMVDISSSEANLANLTRFSIMRLTEVVVDFAFNQIDPENAPAKDKVLPQWNYSFKMPKQLDSLFSGGNVAVSDYVSNAIELNSNPSGFGITSGNFIFDDNGRYIGTISGTSGTGSGGDPYKIDLSDGPIKTNGNSFFTGRLHFVSAGYNSSYPNNNSNRTARITGHGKGDTFARFQNQIHMLKTMVARRVGESSGGTEYYGESGSAFEDTYNNDLGVAPAGHEHRDPNLWLPINMDEQSLQGLVHTLSTNFSFWPPSKVFYKLSRMKEEGNSNDCSAEELLYKGMLPLFLDRFNVENANGAKASKGMVGQPIMGGSIRTIDETGHDHFACISMKTQFDFAKWEDNTLTTNTHTAGKTADGVLMGFKPRLYISEDVTFDISCNTDTTAGSGSSFGSNPKIIQMASGDTTALRVGMKITGLPIPNNSVITQIDSSSLFRINNNVTTTSSPRDLTVDTRKNRVGGSTYNYIIDIDEAVAINSLLDGSTTAEGNISRLFLDVINDLTGCYLVSEAGKYYEEDGSIGSYSSNFITNPSLNGQTPDKIAYILSHTIDTTNTSLRHIITTNIELPVGWYRLMQPNHTCFYNFSPKNIRLNELSSKYTKISGENSCYTDIKDYTLVESAGERTLGNSIGTGASAIHYNTGGQEAALSMYVVLDTENSGNLYKQGKLDIRKTISGETTAGIQMNKSLIIADGENKLRTAVTYTDDDDDIGYFLNFEEMQEMIGVPSISEPFTIKIKDEIEGEYERAMIGTGVTICSETDDLINTLLEENDIEFTSSATNYPLFLAPNYQGIDLFSAINNLLSKKDKVLHFDNTFQIKNRDDSSFFTGILIKDTGDVEIYDYEKTKNMFDFYNEVIVYGKNTKTTRRDMFSISQIGKKTLEVYDDTLITQEETDKHAFQLLKLHTELNEKITITVGHKHLSQLRAGDVIELEIARESIFRNQFLVLQVEHLLLGNMRLQLGRYSKQLEDRFAELAIEQRNIRASTRNVKFDESSVYNTFLEKIKIKPIRLTIRERSSSGGAVLGFGTHLNTNTRPLGHEEGQGVTHTILLEEEY
jgi:hypothetical protein|tara:strand:- start:3807 stop:10829 length:7023 start_codon:yes stop_codon:yes gene_type:complete